MAKNTGKISTLGYALLGLIKMQPSTGYELRLIFRNTPMAGYSSSPGAIYPALRNLESRQLLRVQTGVGKTGRETQSYHCTARGFRELEAWLRSEVTPDSVFRDIDVVLLRFSYLDLIGDPEWTIEFLENFRSAARSGLDHVREISKAMEATQPLHGKLALDNGARILEAHALWAESAIETIRRTQGKQK